MVIVLAVISVSSSSGDDHDAIGEMRIDLDDLCDYNQTLKDIVLNL